LILILLPPNQNVLDVIKFGGDQLIDVLNHVGNELSGDWEIAQELGNGSSAPNKTNLFTLMCQDAETEGLITADQRKQLEAAAPLAKQVGLGVKDAAIKLVEDFEKEVSYNLAGWRTNLPRIPL